MDRNIYIVIPFYNNWELTHSMLWDLYKQEKRTLYQVLLVDDCSTDPEVAGGLKWWKWDAGMPVSVIELEENVGFLRAANRGLDKILSSPLANPNDVIILLSNDVKIGCSITEPILSVLNDQTLVGGVVYWSDTGWNTFNGRTFPYAEGWLLAATVKGWRELGTFDERYAPNDFEDVDLSTKALSLGYELVALNLPQVKHLGGQTLGYNPNRAELTRINQKKFEEKWIK